MTATAVGLVPQLAFLDPERLLILLVIPLMVAAYVFATRRKNRRGMRFTNTSMLDVVVPKQSQWRRHLAVALSLLSLITLTAAFARPKTQVEVPRERATVVLVIDASLSMQATDVEPDRFTAAKDSATDFVEGLPDTFAVGLVSFAGGATVVVPPTQEHERVQRGIGALELGPSTAIGEAVFASLDAIRAVPGEPGQDAPPAAVVLLSDGTNTVGRDLTSAASAALEAGVPVSTISFGTPDGVVEVQGEQVPVPVDADAMQRLAEDTGGSAFTAESGEELRDVYDDIGEQVGTTTERREVTDAVTGLGLALVLVAGAASLVWTSRLP